MEFNLIKMQALFATDKALTETKTKTKISRAALQLRENFFEIRSLRFASFNDVYMNIIKYKSVITDNNVL
jgi:hypothetical protein